jgi:predicted RNase H-like nuclease (RuvC/YqgF family)
VANCDPESQLELEDTQRIERLKVQLLSLVHALDINCSNITALRRGLETLQRDEKFYVESSKYATEREYYTFDQKLDELLFQTNENRKRVKQLILRTDSLFAVVVTIVRSFSDAFDLN